MLFISETEELIKNGEPEADIYCLIESSLVLVTDWFGSSSVATTLIVCIREKERKRDHLIFMVRQL